MVRKPNQSPWIDEQYIEVAGAHIEQFRKIGDRKWQGRCPVCGDSKKNPYKKRFYINWKENEFLVGCFNCNYRAPFWKFLKEIYPSIYTQYRKDKFVAFKEDKKAEEARRIKRKLAQVEKEQKSECDCSGLVVKKATNHKQTLTYLKGRAVHQNYYDSFIYTNNWKKLLCKLGYDQWEYQPDDERVAVLLKDVNGVMKGIQGRCLECDTDSKRYITILFDKEKSAFFTTGDKIKYVVEGVYDAVSIGNSVATLNSDLSRASVFGDGLVYIPDNEPSNRNIVRVVEKLIDAGERVFIPDKYWRYKDLNDAVKEIGMIDVLNYINSHVYSGLKAKMEMVKWKKRK